MKQQEKVAYLKALIYIAIADDTIEEGERKYFKQLGTLYSLCEDDITEIEESVIERKESIEDILKEITERSTKLILLYELLALCYADNSYTLAEKNSMKDICRMMGIEDSKLIELENVMEENLLLQKKINIILER